MSVKNASKVTIKPLPDKTSVQSIRLDFLVSKESEPTLIQLQSKLARALAESILEVLGSDNAPIRPTRAPKGGRPTLKIVKS